MAFLEIFLSILSICAMAWAWSPILTSMKRRRAATEAMEASTTEGLDAYHARQAHASAVRAITRQDREVPLPNADGTPTTLRPRLELMLETIQGIDPDVSVTDVLGAPSWPLLRRVLDAHPDAPEYVDLAMLIRANGRDVTYVAHAFAGEYDPAVSLVRVHKNGTIEGRSGITRGAFDAQEVARRAVRRSYGTVTGRISGGAPPPIQVPRRVNEYTVANTPPSVGRGSEILDLYRNVYGDMHLSRNELHGQIQADAIVTTSIGDAPATPNIEQEKKDKEQAKPSLYSATRTRRLDV